MHLCQKPSVVIHTPIHLYRQKLHTHINEKVRLRFLTATLENLKCHNVNLSVHLLVVNILFIEKGFCFCFFYLPASENSTSAHVSMRYAAFSLFFLPYLMCSYDAISQGDIKIKGSD